METKRVNWTSEDGRVWVHLIPAFEQEANALKGARLGPPDLTPLGWPDELMIRVHNEFHACGLITEQDFRSRRNDVNAAIRRALNADVDSIIGTAWPFKPDTSIPARIPI